ncbi:MAG TPA: prepilin-type N-terminal cleavage/methylation domain-containing protein [bacterium]|nr:prepilin-type N-terminal cleavage/methylation domain-containing protein [bacterium]HPN32545.1 prepilin-type N-terminal cleavage/methylation domain-containing protein [bacterium]
MKKSEAGLSLIELIVAIFIIGIAVSSITALIIIGINKNKTAGDYYKGQLLVSSRIEFLKSISADSAITYDNTVEEYGEIKDYPLYKLQTFVKPVDGDTNLLKIESAAYWQTESGEMKIKMSGANCY